MDKPVKHFQKYSHTERSDRSASHRLGYRQKLAVGEVFWSHPAVPGIAFHTRKAAAEAAEKATAPNSCVRCKFENTCGYSFFAGFNERDELSYKPCVLGNRSYGAGPFFELKVAA